MIKKNQIALIAIVIVAALIGYSIYSGYKTPTSASTSPTPSTPASTAHATPTATASTIPTPASSTPTPASTPTSASTSPTSSTPSSTATASTIPTPASSTPTPASTPTATSTPATGSVQATVNLRTAGNFVILSKSGITTTGTTSIIGDIGVSPIDSTAITGFGLIMDSSNQWATSSLVTGKIYAADYTNPTPAKMTTAVSDMETAYTDAAGRTLPNATELGAGDISTMTLAPGLYKWSTGVHIDNRGVTLSGGANDVWIFQIAQDLTVDNAAIVTLSGGAQAKNIFWQVGGGTGVTLGTTSVFNGNILAIKGIVLNTGATLNGRALAQTAVTLDANAVTVAN